MKYLLTVILYAFLYAILAFVVAFFGRLGYNTCGADRKARVPDWQALRDKLPKKGDAANGRVEAAGNGGGGTADQARVTANANA